MISTEVVVATVGGCFLLANTALTIWLTRKLERRKGDECPDGD